MMSIALDQTTPCASMTSEPTVIYIAGYGRSGSTVIGMMLGDHPHVFCAGELSFAFRLLGDCESLCGCGAALSECPLWLPIRERLRAEGSGSFETAEQVRQGVEDVRKAWWLRLLPWRSARRRALRQEYVRWMRQLFMGIAETSGRRFIVDTSKNAYGAALRIFAMSRLCGFHVLVIHLVRDGRAVIWSHLRQGPTSKGVPEHRRFVAFRATVGWLFGNAAAMLAGRCSRRTNYLRVRYEDLMSNPAGELERIGHFLGLDFSEVAQRMSGLPELSSGHMMAGNVVRKQPKIVLKADTEWKERLGMWPRLLFWCCSWPLALKYGYR